MSSDADHDLYAALGIEPYGVDGRQVVAHFVREEAWQRSAEPIDGQAMWIREPSRRSDVHVAFRGRFVVARETEVELRIVAASAFRSWIDGDELTAGPARFTAAAPEYRPVRRRLSPGEHLIAAHVHGFGVRTRVVLDLDPFLWCRVVDRADDAALDVDWRARELRGYIATGVRTSPLLGWVEWCDTRRDGDWRRADFDDTCWATPAPVEPGLGAAGPADLPPVVGRPLQMPRCAEGRYRERYTGYAFDDPAIQHATTDLEPGDDEDDDGAWRRYDLGRVRNGVVRLTLDAAPGTEVVIALGERLYGGRVVPVVPLSAGATCFKSWFALRGGEQTVEQLSPNGARYVEVLVRGSGTARFVNEEFVEYDALGPPAGAFSCGDAALDKIWRVGVDTLRASADDALIDSARERAQWTGDATTIGLEIIAAAYGDLRLIRRALLQAAQSADAAGIVGACVPADVIYLGTYAAYWQRACVRYVELGGDVALLRELLPAGRANLAALRGHMRSDGAFPDLPWPFVDWGHAVTVDRPDPVLLLIMLDAARALADWERLLERPSGLAGQFERELLVLLRPRLPNAPDPATWKRLGCHATVLALRAGLVPESSRPAALDTVRSHLAQGFPNDPSAPRLRDPSVKDARIITPAFAHYALDVLLDAGDVAFVLDQWRTCWGWMLERGAETWFEVFDDRWSHCHFWSGSPTWQMSRYLLGLWPRWDRGVGEAELKLRPGGDLPGAAGVLAFPGGATVEVAWERRAQAIAWRAVPSIALNVEHDGRRHAVAAGESLELALPAG